MRLKETLAAVMLGMGFIGLGLVWRRLKRKRRGKRKKQMKKKSPAPENDLPNLMSTVGGSSKHAIRFEDLVKLATCENPQLRKYALELVVFKVTQPSISVSSSDSSSATCPLETIFKFCRRLIADVEDENGLKALAVLACLTMHGVSSSSARSTSAWFHSHPRGGDLIDLLASIVETLSLSYVKDGDSSTSATPNTPSPDAGPFQLPLTSSPNDRQAARFAFSPPGLLPASYSSSSSGPSSQPHHPSPTNLYLLKMALGSLFRVTVDAAPAKTFLLDRHPQFLTTVLTLVDSAPSKDVVRFGFFLLHQLALLVAPHQFRVEEAAAVIATALRKYQGEPVLEKLGLQILVILFKTASETDGIHGSKGDGIHSLLTRLIQRESLLLPLVSCFRHASTDIDSDIIYWSCVILHEFTANEIEVKTIAQTPGIFVSLTRALMVAEASPRPLILKIIYQLSAGSELFRLQVLYNRDLLQRIAVVCYVNDPTHADRELIYWCLLLIHDLAMLGPPMTSDLLSICPPTKKKAGDGKDLLEALISIRRLRDPFLSRLLAETLGFFCSDERIHGRLLKAGIVDAVLSYMDTSATASPIDPDLLLWAVASLLNLAMTSKAAQKAILHHGGVSVLLHLIDEDCPYMSPSRGQIAVMAAKTLTMLSQTEENLLVEVEIDESVCVIRVGDRQQNKTLTSSRQSQLTISRSSSAVVVVLDPVASTGVISDMSSFFAAEKSALLYGAAVSEEAGSPRKKRATASYDIDHVGASTAVHEEPAGDKEEDGSRESSSPDDMTPASSQDASQPADSVPSSSSLSSSSSSVVSSEPNVDSLIFHCVSPARLILVWWPRQDRPSSPLLGQIIREAKFDDGVVARMPSDDQYCVIVGKVEDSSCLRVSSFHVGGVESRCVTRLPFAEIAAVAVARGVLLPLIASIEKRVKEKITSNMSEELEWIEIVSRQHMCQRALMSDRIIQLFFDMIRLVDDQLEKVVATRQAFNDNGSVAVSHAVGCLKILSVLAINTKWAELLVELNILDLVAGVLRRLVRIWIEMMAASCAAGDEVSLQTLKNCFSDDLYFRPIDAQPLRCSDYDARTEQIHGPLFKELSMPDLSNETPSSTPPWYVTPDASTPGEKFFTPSLEDESRRFSITSDANAGSGGGGGGGEGGIVGGFDGGGGDDRGKKGFDVDEEKASIDSASRDGEESSLKWPVADPAAPRGSSERNVGFPKDSVGGKSTEPTTANEPDSRGQGAAPRPVSIGQDDEFILLPAFNPDFDEIFTSLTKSALILISNLVKVSSLVGLDSPPRTFPMQKIDTIFAVWSILTSSNAILKQWIGIPASASLSSLAIERLERGIGDADDDSTARRPNEVVTLSAEDKTLGLLLSASRLQATNVNWTFESVRATHGVGGFGCFHGTQTPPSGWYYEVTLLSSGIIQLGWAAKNSAFQPFEGMGVGDTKWSFAFDGSRCKTWNGPVTSERDNNYGREWNEGDVVSCLMRNSDGVGEIEYWLKGESMGPAFTRIDLRKYAWYPAASFATDQMCTFNFGASQFRCEPPTDFVSVQDAIADQVVVVEVSESIEGDPRAAKTASSVEANYAGVHHRVLPTTTVARMEKNRSQSCSTSSRPGKDGVVEDSDEGVHWTSNAELRSDGGGGDSGIEAAAATTTSNGSASPKPTTLHLKHKFSSYCRPKHDLSRDEGGRDPRGVDDRVGGGFADGGSNASFASTENGEEEGEKSTGGETMSERLDGDPFSSLHSLDFGAAFPSMYFECSVHRFANHFSLGFRRWSSARGRSVEDVFIAYDADRKALVFPDASFVEWEPSLVKTALGVGLWFPTAVDSPPRVSFVKDGLISRKSFAFSSASSSRASAHDDFYLPILSRRDLDVNWGQVDFKFNPANAKECKILASSYFYKKMIALH